MNFVVFIGFDLIGSEKDDSNVKMLFIDEKLFELIN